MPTSRMHYPDPPSTREYPDPMWWAPAAYMVLHQAKAAGVRITALRLTPTQQQDVRDYTGQDTMLLGYPVREARA